MELMYWHFYGLIFDEFRKESVETNMPNTPGIFNLIHKRISTIITFEDGFFIQIRIRSLFTFNLTHFNKLMLKMYF